MAGIREVIVFLAAAILFTIEARPSCTFLESEQKVICTGREKDYVLKRGLVSDNNQTNGIILRACRLTDIDLESFHDLYGLRNLDLSVNKLNNLMMGVLEGANLVTHLNLSYNMLSDIPAGFFNQIPNLELLDLKANRINFLKPGIFDAVTRIGFIDLSSNSFMGRYLSPNILDHNSQITFMDFSGSDMSGAPDGLLKGFQIVNFLNLAGCSLRSVPKFATAPNLRTMAHILFINNVIGKLDDPVTFENLVNLEIINFANNAIDSVNEEVFKPMIKLKIVTLTNNKLRVIPDTLFQKITELNSVDLSHNLIDYLPIDAFSGTSISNLDVSANRLTYLPQNFVITLRNSGASLSRFSFSQNPWQCACLKDLLKEVKSFELQYNDLHYNGKVPVCATTTEFYCKRDRNVNQVYIDMFNTIDSFNLKKQQIYKTINSALSSNL